MERDDTAGEPPRPPRGPGDPRAAAGMVLPPAVTPVLLFGGWEETAVRMSP